MFICVTHVDYKTKIPGFKQPMKNGPSFPDVKGLNIVWWDLSRWPLTHPDQYPKFYGTCDDDADTNIDGVIEVLDEESYNILKAEEEFRRLPSEVTPSQFRLALLQKEMLSNVLNTIELIEEPLRSAIKLDWEFTLNINRYSPLINKISNVMNWDSNTVTDIFVTASNIQISEFEPDS